MARSALTAALVCVAVACAERTKEPDDALSVVSPTGPRVTHAQAPFVRVGVMMDAHAADALELRTSVDGVAWTAWQPLTVVFAEGEAFAGHVDAPPGSRHFEYRFTDPRRPPRWLLVEDIEALGEPSLPLEPGPPPAAAPAAGRRVDALAPFPAILPRAAWGARAPTCRSLTNPYRLVVHHTASPTNDTFTPEARLRQTQAFHMDTRGYCDVAYNFLMSRDARVWEGRGDGVLGGHTLNQNAGNMALCVIGTYTTDTLTPQQSCALAGWMAWQSSLHGIALNRTNIKGHREWGATECPGNTLFAQLDALVTQAATTCPGVTPPRPEWGGEFVGQSFPGAHLGAIRLELGATLDGWFELRNIGARGWTTAATRLAPTPRDRASALVDPTWLSPTRVVGAPAATATGQVARFPVRLRGNTLGSVTQTFGLLQEGVAWFADQGGPADTFITVRVDVVPRGADAGAPVSDAGLPPVDAGVPEVDAGVEAPMDVEGEPVSLAAYPEGTATLPAPMGCGCASVDASAVLALASLCLARRRRVASSR
ncbi:MAG: N-acetylmuramoyl-L-alanine amidase [Myxococcus sp.]|nr:N-acetylmuramoyl-L-alanine amidase [Myxococcus sp.]